MAEIKEFVVNDRRKFTAEGDVRPDAPPPQPKAPRPETLQSVAPPKDEFGSSAKLVTPTGPQAVPDKPVADKPVAEAAQTQGEDDFPPPPTAEQTEQATRAYDATVDRLDTAIRATNPGTERAPEMSFERLVQSIYMQAILQLGGAGEPGKTPQVDLMGARQSIDMLAIIAQKSKGNLADSENMLIESALFEMRMGFLEVTQALARQAQSRQSAGPGIPGAPTGPSIVR